MAFLQGLSRSTRYSLELLSKQSAHVLDWLRTDLYIYIPDPREADTPSERSEDISFVSGLRRSP